MKHVLYGPRDRRGPRDSLQRAGCGRPKRVVVQQDRQTLGQWRPLNAAPPGGHAGADVLERLNHDVAEPLHDRHVGEVESEMAWVDAAIRQRLAAPGLDDRQAVRAGHRRLVVEPRDVLLILAPDAHRLPRVGVGAARDQPPADFAMASTGLLPASARLSVCGTQVGRRPPSPVTDGVQASGGSSAGVDLKRHEAQAGTKSAASSPLPSVTCDAGLHPPLPRPTIGTRD